jgi:hypothetical protein
LLYFIDFNNDIIAWTDITLSLWDYKFKQIDINKINTNSNLMNYYNKKLKAGMAFIYSNIKQMSFIINEYIKVYNNNNDKYCHDEETLFSRVYENNKDLFNLIDF